MWSILRVYIIKAQASLQGIKQRAIVISGLQHEEVGHRNRSRKKGRGAFCIQVRYLIKKKLSEHRDDSGLKSPACMPYYPLVHK